MPISHKRVGTESLSSSEITPISTSMNSEEAENSTGEEASQITMAAKSKETEVEKVTTGRKWQFRGKRRKQPRRHKTTPVFNQGSVEREGQHNDME